MGAENTFENKTKGEEEGETRREAESKTEDEGESGVEGEAEDETRNKTEGEVESKVEGETEGETEDKTEGKTEDETEHRHKRPLRWRMALAILACVLVLLCAVGLSNCQSTTDPTLDTTDISGGVAATVNGVEIGENAITAYIENFRSARGLEDDDDWGEWLVSYEYTIDSMREEVLDYYINRELLLQAAEDYGVSATEAEITEEYEASREQFSSDEEFEAALASSALNEETYRDRLKLTLLQEKMIEAIGADVSASDEEVLAYVQIYASSYDGSKRSSHILFAADDEESAQEVLDLINAGELDFAEAAAEYSLDESSAEGGGDVGWDAAATFVDEYQTALDELEVGEVSGLVTSDYGIHIIMCTDQFESPETIESLDDVSEGFLETMREMADTVVKQQAYSDYMNEFEEAAEIERADLPDDASYVIDLTPYEEAALGTSDDSDDSEDTDDTDATTE